MSRVVMAVVTLVAAAAAMAWAGVRAGPLDRRLVPADVTWVFHIDLEAARGSRLGALVESEWQDAALSPEELEQWRRVWPVLERVRSVTVYGKNDPDRAVALLRTTGTPGEFFEALRFGDPRREVVEGTEDAEGRALLTWVIEGETVYGYALEGESEGTAGMILLSNNAGDLVAAIETAKGGGPNLAEVGTERVAGGGDRRLAEAAEARPGSVVLFAAGNLDMLPREARASFLLENARALRVEVGEHEGQVYGTVRLTAESAERARQLADLGRGVVAMAQMMAGQEARFAGLRGALGTISIETEGESATLSFTYDAATALEAVLEARRAGHEPREANEKEGRPAKDEKRKRGPEGR